MSVPPWEKLQGWELVENPAYAGKTPTPLKPVCHDGTPFLSVRCGCGYQMHMHESQTSALPAEAELASRCHGCGELLVFPPGWFQSAFAELRKRGWIE